MTSLALTEQPTMTTLSQRLANKELILIDGATGTELERAGVPTIKEAWTAATSLSHPEVVRQVHENYIQAGAQMIIANTYSCSRHLLAKANLDDKFEELNQIGIKLAYEARDNQNAPDVVVAGSISTTEMMQHEQPPVEVALQNYVEQAQIQAAAGAEMICLEMLREITHTQLAIDAVQQTGLPVWVGYSCIMKDGVPYLFNGDDTLEDAVKAIKGQNIEVVSIMHTETVDVDACLDVVQKYWDGPIGVYAQSGEFIPPVWQFIDTITPEDYAAACFRWVDRGVQVIGGCCGIGREHIEYLNEHLPR